MAIHMFNWTVLYVSCTKINVMHLSTSIIYEDKNIDSVQISASSLDNKLPTRWREHTQKD